jgi:acyl-phosphate glycerol 3-phosphate acyltransferase
MNSAILFILIIVVSYLVGAIPFGYLIARWKGIDIQKQGSGNIGATNVGRVLGRRFGLLAFGFDFCKGVVPTACAVWLGGEQGASSNLLGVAAGMATILGHMFPVYLRFRGGKGVATGAGVVLVLAPMAAFGALVIFAACILVSRYVSLASMVAALSLCVFDLVFSPAAWAMDQLPVTLFCIVAAGLVIFRHRGNIQRLLDGTEHQIREGLGTLRWTKMIHVLVLGLWFGSNFFFSLVATPVIFSSFARVNNDPGRRLPFLKETFTQEDASRLAGLAVGPIFPWYFMLQGTCGVVALVTAAAWMTGSLSAPVHRLRFNLLALALMTVFVGLLIAARVEGLRAARFADDAGIAMTARSEFGRWHGYSLLLNFATLGLVGFALGLAARLPEEFLLDPETTSSSEC